MIANRKCPHCENLLPTNDPRRKWCSGRCRRWVSSVGGPLQAAELKEAWARTWQVLADASYRRSEEARAKNRETAVELRRQAAALRAVARKS